MTTEKEARVLYKSAQKILLSQGEDPAFAEAGAPLLLLRPAMEQYLNDHGISHTGALSDIAIKFDQAVNGNGFEKENCESCEYRESCEKENCCLFEKENFKLSPSLITGVVDGATGFFHSLQQRKNAGEALSPAEDKLLNDKNAAASAAASKAKQMAEETIAEKFKNFLFSWKGAVAGGGILALIIGVIYLSGKAHKAPAA
ncbi:MAG: hypothetical protein KGJ07_03695 [Patescibacteria group bacterium]|nr:hypothetical protein [Patescibacteria group bacterium]